MIIDPKKGILVDAKVFDTYKSSASLDHFLSNDIPKGYIVIAACKDDCISNLSQKAKQWFIDQGSDEINLLKYRESFVFIGI